MSVISEEELQEIVEVVWMTVLELPVQAGNPSDLAVCDYVTAMIEISGAWNGLVAVRASEQFLNHAAALMFSVDRADVTEMDCRDTLTELTNMLGGTVKCLLPETCDLALPVILAIEADDGEHEWMDFSCEQLPLAVAVSPADAARQAA